MKKLLIGALIAGVQVSGYCAIQQDITGAGSSFVYPVMATWAKDYQGQNKKVKINYQSMGSSAGIEQLKNNTVDFAATDKPVSSAVLKKMKWQQMPIVMGAIVPVVHINKVSATLVLSGPVLANIYQGKIKFWDDKDINKLNPKIKLPHQRIIPVHRADGSGTTYNFTKYLASQDSSWQKTVGVGTTVKWKGATIGAKGNAGVASEVKILPGAIGYVEYNYAKSTKINLVKMINNSKHEIIASNNAFISAANSLSSNQAWPIMATTYVDVVKANKKSTSTKKFFSWIVKHGAKEASALDYVPVTNKSYAALA